MCVSLSANNKIVVLGRHVSGCVRPFWGDTSAQFCVTHPSWAAPMCITKCQPWLDITVFLCRTKTFKVVANQPFPFSGEHGWQVWADHDWKPPEATVWSGRSGNLQVTRVPGQSRFWALGHSLSQQSRTLSVAATPWEALLCLWHRQRVLLVVGKLKSCLSPWYRKYELTFPYSLLFSLCIFLYNSLCIVQNFRQA